MNRLTFAAMALLIACAFPAFSQNDKTTQKKPAEQKTSLLPRTIYIIDGVRSDFVYDYTHIKSDEVASMSIVTDPNEIKKYVKSTERIGTVIVVETTKTKPNMYSKPTATTKSKVTSSN